MNLEKLLKNNSNIFLIVLAIIVFVFYFLDKDLSKVLGIAGFFVWFLQKYTEQLFAKDLVEFKFGLQKEAMQFKIRYEKLHSERAEIIKEVYKKIIGTYKSFHSLMCPLQLAGEPTEEEEIKLAVKEINELVDYYEENRIFFEEELAKEIDKLLRKFRESWNQFNYSKDLKDGNGRDAKEWNKAWKQISEDVPVVKQLIEKRFRSIIGIIDK
ncbi:MAG: hypothetical protein KAQ87_04380 [Candidatus Pacebacteria bacterium]|nr:hypothetical protein [Candidatus Paceibacterota bacterium]